MNGQALPRPADDRPVVDVQLAGTVYLDLIFSGLAGPPEPGRELRSTGFGAVPGGVANVALALRRLDLSVRLAATFSTDLFGRELWAQLITAGVDLSGARQVADWPTPITVSLSWAGDRSMITHERREPAPPVAVDPAARPARAAIVFLGRDTPGWLAAARAAGTIVVADVGWDETGSWAEADLAALDACDAFLPNQAEAMAYTRTANPETAAERLAERVPLVVVKCGPGGSLAWPAGATQPIIEPPIEVETVDPTGAGDVFDAAFVYGLLAGWPVRESLRFGNLCAGLSVRRHGGSLSAPDWTEIRAWLDSQPDRAAEYPFLGARTGGRPGPEAAQITTTGTRP